MQIIEFERKLHSLLLNHLNGKYYFNDYLELLEYENNSLINYVLSHAYFMSNDLTNSEKYRLKAIELNSNFEFEADYKNISEYIFRIFSTITTISNPFTDKKVEEILNQNPSVEDYYKLSENYRTDNDVSTAVKILNEGLKQYPNKTLLKYALASNLLYSRNINNAWEYNEQRFDEVRNKLPQYIDRPKFNFQKNSAKIYIYPVTKLGDTIFFSRYLFKLKKEYPGLKLFTSPEEPLKKIFEQNLIRTYSKPERSMVDYQISFEGLPYIFRNENSKIFQEGYLIANRESSEKFKQRYFNTDKLKVGIVWRTSNAQDLRNISLELFKELFTLDNIQFYSLQKDINFQEEMTAMTYRIPNLGIKFNDFSDTAAAIDNLDLIIGCDTSVTNLAGAMNKNTIIILPYNADWRWGLFEQQSLWYNSIQLYRQKKNQGYDEAISRVKNYLKHISLKNK